MKKVILLVLLLGLFCFASSLFLLSCQKKEEPKEEKCTSGKEKKLVMYKMSEMAALMEQMYVDNLRVKKQIINGEAIGQFPKHFLKIHTAKFTDEFDNDAFFKSNALLYINAQKLIYSDPKNVKQHFNEGVNTCLNCHKNKCGGPIPRIKKLYIK